MKRPLVAVVCCYATGLLLGELFQPPLVALFGIAFVVLVLALVLEKLRPRLIWPLLALVGWVNFAVHTQVISPQDLRRLLSNESELVTVRGTLAETPGQRVYVHDKMESWRTLARLEVTGLARGTNRQPASGQIIVATPGKTVSSRGRRRRLRGGCRKWMSR
jgi:hypothetical protein